MVNKISPGRSFKLALLLVITSMLFFGQLPTGWASPRILAVTPSHFSQLDQVSEVTAFVYEVSAEPTLEIDGQAVPVTWAANEVTYGHSFSPGLHKAYLRVSDNLGNQAEKVWEFYVNNPVQPGLLPDKATCEQCHPNTWKNFPGHAVDERLTNFAHPHSCGACHIYSNNATPETQLILRADGTVQITYCTSCHAPHSMTGNLYLPPAHGSTNWKGTWSADNTLIKAPRFSLDCQYCHQPGTKVRLGHDLVADHQVDEAKCTSCHSNILTVTHNKGSNSCQTCHSSTDSLIQGIAQQPLVARGGEYSFQTSKPDSVLTVVYNELNVSSLSLQGLQSNTQYISPEWSPGPGLEIKRVKVDGWSENDQQYLFAYVEREDKWYALAIADEGKSLYGRYPADSKARELYLPAGTTKVKTVVQTGSGLNFDGLEVKAVYANKPAKCTDCHVADGHESLHQAGVDQYCANCHKKSLIQEHTNNPLTSAGHNYDCVTCHSNNAVQVERTISNDSLNCAGCHRQGHQLAFNDEIPGDLPLYNGFQWSTPIEGVLSQGEPNTPAPYETGQYIISNRRLEATPSQIWQYYLTAMPSLGWQQTAVAPDQIGDYFTAEYTKGVRSVTILCYRTAERNGNGNPSSQGSRIELWYKGAN